MKKPKLILVLLTCVVISNLSTAQLYLNSSGYVSLGSTSSALTYVQSFNSHLFSGATSGTASAAWIHDTAAFSTAKYPDYSWWYDSQTGMYHPSVGNIGFTTGNYETMAISSGGYGQVLMYNSNTSTSSYPQAVISYLSSTTSVTWNLIEGGSNKNFYVFGNGAEWAITNNLISDARMKHNINTIQNALSKVVKMRGVTYQLNAIDSSAFYKKTRMGLIAQEVQKVAPEVVDMGQDSILGIEYANLVGLLVEAIKAQNARIDSLATALTECCNRTHERNQHNGQDSGSSPNNGPNQQQGTPKQQQSSLFNQSQLMPAGQQALLFQNIPNPFTQATTIACYIPEQSQSASIMVFDMSGVLKRTYPITGKTNQSIIINGSELVAGMYLYSLIIDNREIDTKKMILTK